MKIKEAFNIDEGDRTMCLSWMWLLLRYVHCQLHELADRGYRTFASG